MIRQACPSRHLWHKVYSCEIGNFGEILILLFFKFEKFKKKLIKVRYPRIMDFMPKVSAWARLPGYKVLG